MTAFLFLLSQLLLAVLGGGVLLSSYIRRFTILGRCAFCFLSGALFLTIEATLFSIVRVPWHVSALAVPPLVLSAVALWRRPARSGTKLPDPKPVAPLLPIVIVILSVLHLAAGIGTTRSTSIDYVLFWGVKAVRFAQARAIDAAFLVHPFSAHSHINYPPLVPVTNAWGTLISGGFPWLWATLTSWIWFVATLPVLYSILRMRMTRDTAATVTAFWSTAMSLSLTVSMNGGNAEIPLLAYETLACALVLVTPPDQIRQIVVPLSILFAGAVLTKQEGAVAVVLLVVGGVVRDWLTSPRLRLLPWLRAIVFPIAAIGTWWVFSLMNGIPLSDPIREKALAISFDHAPTIARATLQNLHAGSWGLSWLLVLGALFVLRRGWRQIFPALALAGGLLVFSAFFFLHVRANHEMIITWILPRLSQPALSALILAAGLAAFGGLLNDDPGVSNDGAVVAVDVS